MIKKHENQYKDSRQEVTGLVVNKKPNTKNEYWRTRLGDAGAAVAKRLDLASNENEASFVSVGQFIVEAGLAVSRNDVNPTNFAAVVAAFGD